MLLIVAMPPVWAHSALQSAHPAVDGVVEGPVDTLLLTFGQPVRVLSDDVSLQGPSGVVATGDAVVQADRVTVAVPVTEATPAGQHIVVWRVIGADGHPIEGTHSFTVTGPAPTPAQPAQPAEPGVAGTTPTPTVAPPSTPSTPLAAVPVSPRPSEPAPPLGAAPLATAPADSAPVDTAPADTAPAVVTDPDAAVDAPGADAVVPVAGVVARWLAYVGVMLTGGVLVFAMLVHPHPLEDRGALDRLLVVGAATMAVGSVAQLVVRTVVVSGDGISGMFDVDAMAIVADGGLVPAATIRIAAATLAFAASRTGTWHRLGGPGFAGLTAAIGAVLSFQLTGHTASSEPAALVRVADAVHVGAATVWTGGVASLLVVVAGRRRASRRVDVIAARFASVAAASVVLVGLAGLALTVIALDAPTQLWTTGYGQVLLAKLAVVGVIGAIGAVNHFRVVPRLEGGAGAGAADGALHRLLRVELAAFATAVVLTSALVGLSP
ncbi:Copper resistance protein CopC [Euzebya pacifica]|uniref:Copper resistance protein CopC n=1 Tax=Euzebya pacifica TaxID=1608957 RepID=A0A346Y0I0_9ACTN|nr:Copper resistance protein CopC [Euzebya pacifica]